MGQRANKSQLGRHSKGWPGSRVRHSPPRVPDKRGGASQGAQPSRLRSPKRAKAPRSEGAYYPPTKGEKATRSVGAAYLLLLGGCPARGRLGGGRGRGGGVGKEAVASSSMVRPEENRRVGLGSGVRTVSNDVPLLVRGRPHWQWPHREARPYLASGADVRLPSA